MGMDRELISELAYKIRARREVESAEDQLQLLRFRLKETQAPKLFEELGKALAGRVEALRDQLGDLGSDLAVRRDHTGINISKDDSPFVKFKLEKPDYSGELRGVYNSGHHKPVGDDKMIVVQLAVGSDDIVFFRLDERRMTADELADHIMPLLFLR